MNYSKEFRDLIACANKENDFIGYGNPNAKILIIGKEESLDKSMFIASLKTEKYTLSPDAGLLKVAESLQ